MKNLILDRAQIQELVFQNRYPVNDKTKLLSRCIDGRYLNEKNLPALAIPGGDLGELALVLATGNSFGFEVFPQKALTTLTDLLGGVKNFQWHTSCGYWREIRADPAAYDLEKKEIDFIAKNLPKLKKQGSHEEILTGEHLEGAVLHVLGPYSIYPRFFLEEEEGKREVEVFVYQQTLVDQRHRALVRALLKNKAVKLYPGCDEEYLYQVLSEEIENHLFETTKRLAKDLPIYAVKFKDDGDFEIKEMGQIV